MEPSLRMLAIVQPAKFIWSMNPIAPTQRFLADQMSDKELRIRRWEARSLARSSVAACVLYLLQIKGPLEPTPTKQR